MENNSGGAPLSIYSLDLDKVDNGSWLHGKEGSGHLFKVKRIRGLDFNKEMDEIKREVYRAAMPDFPDDSMLFAMWLGKYGCTDWDGVQDYEGNHLPFSRDTCINVFRNRELWYSLAELLTIKASHNEAYYKTEALEAIEEIKKR